MLNLAAVKAVAMEAVEAAEVAAEAAVTMMAAMAVVAGAKVVAPDLMIVTMDPHLAVASDQMALDPVALAA